MVEQWIVFGGWATEASILTPLFGPKPILVDTTALMPWLVTEGTLRSDWQAVIGDVVAELMPKDVAPRAIGIAGWSTGAMLAYTTAARINPKAAVLLSATPSFCRRPGFALGWKAAILRSMREKVMTEPERVLEQFHAACGLATDFYQSIRSNDASGSVSSTARQALADGLCFLEQVTLLPVMPLLCPTLLMHGRSDAIVPFQAGKWFCEETGGLFVEFDGPHAFFISHEKKVAEWIEEFVAVP